MFIKPIIFITLNTQTKRSQTKLHKTTTTIKLHLLWKICYKYMYMYILNIIINYNMLLLTLIRLRRKLSKKKKN